ncbi:40S ribosomal protein S8 [Perkinsela sp. CCAP 1560/4]|nr:40S ribosomal protein S8 [Perkinsela sp. CCAP 1560/4]|eukprot:KNH08333.1 40S ribosomal protein S8 [Perkinsela sp. CCAP 1560/4]
MPPLFEELLCRYRRDGCAILPSALPEKVIQMMCALYTKAVDIRHGSSYPDTNFQGPLTKIYGAVPQSHATKAPNRLLSNEQILHLTGKDSGVTSFQEAGSSAHELKKIAIKCRSIKHRDRVIKRLQKKLGPRFMTSEEYGKVFGQEDLLSNPHFMEHIDKMFYYKEYHQYVDAMSSNKFNAFQSLAEIKNEVLLADPEIIPFSTAAHLTGCVALRLWCENLFTKRPMSNAYPLHCTLPFIGLCNNRGEVESRGCTVWVFLDDVPKECGGICILKNTHSVMKEKFALIEDVVNEKHAPMPYEFDAWYREYVQPEDGKKGASPDVYCPDIKKGDVLILSNAALHGISANPSNRSWKALQYHLVPDGSIFAGYRGTWVPRRLLKDAKPGDYVEDEANFPIVHNAL